MGEVHEWPSVDNLPKKEVREDIKQIFYFEFVDGAERTKAMKVINKLRETNPDIFAGLQYVKPDPNLERQYQGLEFAFSTQIDDRDQKILGLLHSVGVFLNTKDGVEEKPYPGDPNSIGRAA